MPETCCVLGCRAGAVAVKTKNTIKFYRFPNDKVLLEKWKSVLQVNQPLSHHRVCSLHFTNDDFKLTNLGWKVLGQRSVPSLNLPDVQVCLQEMDTSEGTLIPSHHQTSSNNECNEEIVDNVRAPPPSSLQLLHSPTLQHKMNVCGEGNLKAIKFKLCSEAKPYQKTLKNTDHVVFKCFVCLKTVEDRISLLMHLAQHHFDPGLPSISRVRRAFHVQLDTDPFFCSLCGCTYSTRKDLQCHKMKDHDCPDDSISCLSCKRTFKSSSLLRNHVENAHLQDKFFCGRCDRIFSTYSDMQLHNLCHGSSSECPECCLHIEEISGLLSHLECHAPVSFYSCNYCNLIFSSCEAVMAHIETHSCKVKSADCYFCVCTPLLDSCIDYHAHKIIDVKTLRAQSQKNRYCRENDQTVASAIPQSKVGRQDQNSISSSVHDSHKQDVCLQGFTAIKVENSSAETNTVASLFSEFVSAPERRNSPSPDSDGCDRSSISKEHVSNFALEECSAKQTAPGSSASDISCNSSTSQTLSDTRGIKIEPPDCVAANISCHPRLLGCEDCNKIFLDEKELSHHQDLHRLKGDFSCMECGEYYDSSKNLSAHYNDHMKQEIESDSNSDEDQH